MIKKPFLHFTGSWVEILFPNTYLLILQIIWVFVQSTVVELALKLQNDSSARITTGALEMIQF